MIRLARQFFAPPRPQPPAAPRQTLPIKTYPVASAGPKPIGPHSRAEDLVTCIGPGSYRIRVPKNRDPRPDAWLGRDPFSLAHEMTISRLLHETVNGTIDWPDGIDPPKPPTPEERRAERIATIRRVAEGPRDYAAMLKNEGFDPLDHPWEQPSVEGRKTFTAWRRTRELLGLARAKFFGRD